MKRIILGALLALASFGAYAQPAPSEIPGCVYNSTPPTLANFQTAPFQCDVNGRLKLSITGLPTGNVVGPASSTDNAFARWDGLTGKLLKDSRTTESATGLVTVNPTVNTASSLVVADGSSATPAVSWSTESGFGIARTASNQMTFFSAGGTSAMSLNAAAIQARSNGLIGFTSAAANGTLDTILARDAANTLAQRNGTTAQTYRIYNTYTDASNYERGVMDWATTANSLTIGTQNAGTGSARGIIFATGATPRWNILSTGPLIASVDNTLDIGSSGANRPRTGYFGTSVISPLFTGRLNTTDGYTVTPSVATGYIQIYVNGVAYKVNACLASGC